jgi:glycosyltransferase involved in cell wall biosynthesis
MVAHLLTSNQKRRLQQATRFLDRVDLTLVFSRPQERYLLDEVGLDPARAAFVYDKVDHTFFVPGPTRPSDTFVLAVGREQRDYRTLVQALTMTGLPGVIVAGSTWSHRSLGELELPAHVRIAQGLSYPELLGLYQRATLVTVPVEPGTDYAAGVNGVLEAMACAVPTIVSDTPGLEGYVEDRVDGWTLPAGEPSVLADAISQLWNDPAERERLGKAGRATVEAGRTIETFADRIAAALGA